ncbi:hypothetical protein HZC34_07150 [Candidatus Saganbacteria bacterium]|nr:hypothetical protein [Candidatus Saganbacteria bacterium]
MISTACTYERGLHPLDTLHPFMKHSRLRRGIGAVTTGANEVLANAGRVHAENLASTLSHQALVCGTIVFPEIVLEHELQILRFDNTRLSLVQKPDEMPIHEIQGLLAALKSDLLQKINMGEASAQLAEQVAKLSLFQKDDADAKLLADLANRKDIDVMPRWVAALIHDSRGGDPELLSTLITEETVEEPKTIALADEADYIRKGVVRLSVTPVGISDLSPIVQTFDIKDRDKAQARSEARRFLSELPYLIVDNHFYLFCKNFF